MWIDNVYTSRNSFYALCNFFSCFTESIRSPMREFTQVNFVSLNTESTRTELGIETQPGQKASSLDSVGSGSQLLHPPRRIPITPSYEDIASVSRQSAPSPSLFEESSAESDDNIDILGEKFTGSREESVHNSFHFPREKMDAKERREKYHTFRRSSSGRIKESGSSWERSSLEAEDILTKRKQLMEAHATSDSDSGFSFISQYHSPKSKRMFRHQTIGCGTMSSLRGREGQLRKRPIDKATGILMYSTT